MPDHQDIFGIMIRKISLSRSLNHSLKFISMSKLEIVKVVIISGSSKIRTFDTIKQQMEARYTFVEPCIIIALSANRHYSRHKDEKRAAVFR